MTHAGQPRGIPLYPLRIESKFAIQAAFGCGM